MMIIICMSQPLGIPPTSDWMLLWDMSSLTVWAGSTGNWERPAPEQSTETVKEGAGREEERRTKW